MKMGIGWIVSLTMAGILMAIILSIAIPMDKKYVIRKKGKIDYKRTTVYLRWNVFDTITLSLAIYTIICVQALNFLVSSGQTVDNPYVQFFTNQSQVWTLVTIMYLISRVSITLKTIQERWGDDIE
jgi:hypothetical protein